MGPYLILRMLNETWRLLGPERTLLPLLCGSISNSPPLLILIKKVRALALFLTYLTVFFPVPIYDARTNPFMFSRDDFVGLPSLPHFKKYGDPKRADLPPNALVTVFFTSNTYASTRAPPTPSTFKNISAWSDGQVPIASTSSHRDNSLSPVKGGFTQSGNASNFGSSQVLSLNLQFLLYHGQIPEDD